jgi:hypothetical protein
VALVVVCPCTYDEGVRGCTGLCKYSSEGVAFAATDQDCDIWKFGIIVRAILAAAGSLVQDNLGVFVQRIPGCNTFDLGP